MRPDYPRLIADVGGTFARFALEVAPGVLEQGASLRCAEFADFRAAVAAYLGGLQNVAPGAIRHAAVAIANPVTGDAVRMTNYHWQFSIEEMRQSLQWDHLLVVNDFTALAMALPAMDAQQRRQVGGGGAVPRSVVGLIGAGTGLGVSALVPTDDGWVALGTEGGHASFSPCDAREIAILEYAWRHFGHVSFERLLSGAGVELMFRALCARAGQPERVLRVADITRMALEGQDAVCRETIDAFCAILGTAAANVALSQGALGGIYISGGIVQRLGAYFDQSAFRQRFEDKGRMAGYLKAVPTFVITAADATLRGAAVILAAHLRAQVGVHGPTILNQIQGVLDRLSKAEQRVARHVLAQPRSVLNDPIGQIAFAADVSQPTVIRFCRSLGCKGLTDFKLRLASGLASTIAVTHAQVSGLDSLSDVGVQLLGSAARAILQARDHLNQGSLHRAARLIAGAERIEIYAGEDWGAAASEAQLKFLRIGVSAAAYVDPASQALAVALVSQGTVVVVLGSGDLQTLTAMAHQAQQRGARVVAVAESRSALARTADVALMVDQVENMAGQSSTISRMVYQLMVDILAAAVARERRL